MKPFTLRPRAFGSTIRGALAVLCAALLGPGDAVLLAQQVPTTASAAAAVAAAGGPAEEVAKLPPDQLDSLVAPVALYPDDLLAQVLAASTYPLELMQLQQWLAKHKELKDKALADAVAKQPWDPSVQSMAAIPEALKRLTDDIQWTTDLGNAFLDQQQDVMDACQRMRKKAKDKGSLASNEQQKVETKVIEQKETIIIQPANPEVVYVPSYSPTVVYGASYYPYPPIYYPPYYPGTALISFGIGMAWGAAIWGGSCCGCGWGGGGNNVYINHNNNFNRNTDINRGDRGQGDRGQGIGARAAGARGETTGRTTPRTGAARLTPTRPRRTSTAARPGATLSPAGSRRAPGSKARDRAAAEARRRSAGEASEAAAGTGAGRESATVPREARAAAAGPA